ncbi:hypothetical protein HYZ97_00670 [Candidatus Pacearchaeota archaeon]|nr:hypothetical protein [Candidatus Pacearchaeota archaeon]
MKHSFKVTALLLVMFIIAQIIGIAVTSVYAPTINEVIVSNTTVNVTNYNLPYGLEPPEDTTPKMNVFSIVLAFILAIGLMVVLMRVNAELFLRLWFFLVITLALAVSIYALLFGLRVSDAAILSLGIALPLSFWKMYRRNVIIHNVTELFIYPGIAAIFVPLLSIGTTVALLFIISLYDMYAVWHSGFMQRMAKYQIKTLKVFSGFFVPYLSQKERALMARLKKSGKKQASMKVHVAILGGGDIVFPIILAGVVLHVLGLLPALAISLGSTIALALLFMFSERGKFYPAMPFITAGCLLGLGIAYLI